MKKKEKQEQSCISRGYSIWWEIDKKLPELSEKQDCEQYTNLFKTLVTALPASSREDLKAWVNYQIHQLEHEFADKANTLYKNMYRKYQLQQQALKEL